MKFRFAVIIIDEDWRAESASGLGIRALAKALEEQGGELVDGFSYLAVGMVADHLAAEKVLAGLRSACSRADRVGTDAKAFAAQRLRKVAATGDIVRQIRATRCWLRHQKGKRRDHLCDRQPRWQRVNDRRVDVPYAFNVDPLFC